MHFRMAVAVSHLSTVAGAVGESASGDASITGSKRRASETGSSHSALGSIRYPWVLASSTRLGAWACTSVDSHFPIAVVMRLRRSLWLHVEGLMGLFGNERGVGPR